MLARTTKFGLGSVASRPYSIEADCHVFSCQRQPFWLTFRQHNWTLNLLVSRILTISIHLR